MSKDKIIELENPSDIKHHKENETVPENFGKGIVTDVQIVDGKQLVSIQCEDGVIRTFSIPLEQ